MIENNNPNRKPIIYYILIAGAVIMLLNAFVFPSLLQRQVQSVGYSDFLNMIDAGQVTEVQLDENSNQLVFLAKDSNGMEGIGYLYKSGKMNYIPNKTANI